MSVTGVAPANRAAILEQIDRLTSSEVLHGSESLCKLLRYLADHALESPGVALKEYQIATEVFGRTRDFDPRLDSTVRVQTGRLRTKLAEYYGGAGSEDPVIVEVPKGAYALQVRFRPAPIHAPVPRAASDAVGKLPGAKTIAWLLTGVSAVLVMTLLAVLASRPAVSVQSATAEMVAPALQTFWADFIDSPDRPWVVFSNAEFVGRPETGMRYFDASREPRTGILDHYTGVGEVIAVHDLDTVFTQLRHTVRVKRGRLLSLDDAKNNDIIFVGSPSENLALRELPTTRDFVFRVIQEGERKGDLGIMNTNPRAGEQSVYVATKVVPITDDYALIGLAPGLDPSLRVMVLAGTTTIGTQAAAEFVTRAKDVDNLLSRLGVTDRGRVPTFEAVLHVNVNKGVPVSTDIVALHSNTGR